MTYLVCFSIDLFVFLSLALLFLDVSCLSMCSWLLVVELIEVKNSQSHLEVDNVFFLFPNY